MENTSVLGKLVKIQSELKAPKGQFNSFAKYYYRSCEDITESAKPLCAKYGAVLTLSDQILLIGDRYYVEATAKLTDIESGQSVYVTASAREEETKKGSDASQITGASSSYARKYALSGLFALDDTKDSDFTNTGDGSGRKSSPKTLVGSGEAEEPKNYVCAGCGKPFEGFTSKSGKTFSAAQVYHMAQGNNTDGVARCRECREKAGTTKPTEG